MPPAPGMTPSLISGWPNLAVSAAMMMSHIMASSQPPPSAKPATAATIGLRRSATRSQRGDEVLLVGLHVGLSPAISLMSAPAANALSLPVITMQPMPSIGLEAVERRVDARSISVAVERVQRLRAVEGDEPHAAARLDDDGFVSHGVSPLLAAVLRLAKGGSVRKGGRSPFPVAMRSLQAAHPAPHAASVAAPTSWRACKGVIGSPKA